MIPNSTLCHIFQDVWSPYIGKIQMDKKEQNRRCETGEWRTFSKCAEKRLTRQEDSFTPHVFVIIIIIIIQISAEITPNIFTSFWGVAEQIFFVSVHWKGH